MVPKHWDLMQSVLEACGDGKPHHRSELLSTIGTKLNLSDEDLNELQASGNQTVFENRLGWATFHLKQASFVEQNRGNVIITDDGKNVLNKSIPVDKKFLRTVPKYQEYMDKVREYNKRKQLDPIIEEGDSSDYSPEDRIEEGYREIRRDIENELLERISKNNPWFFESLVVELVKKMGYGVEHEVTKKSGDGGIDGIIAEDKLRLDEIYLQAKRWESVVPVDQVKSFAGSMLARKSKKGIFITSSDFTKEAQNFVENADTNMILINGKKLVEYMYDHDVGVTKAKMYEIKKVDEDYFPD